MSLQPDPEPTSASQAIHNPLSVNFINIPPESDDENKNHQSFNFPTFASQQHEKSSLPTNYYEQHNQSVKQSAATSSKENNYSASTNQKSQNGRTSPSEAGRSTSSRRCGCCVCGNGHSQQQEEQHDDSCDNNNNNNNSRRSSAILPQNHAGGRNSPSVQSAVTSSNMTNVSTVVAVKRSRRRSLSPTFSSSNHQAVPPAGFNPPMPEDYITRIDFAHPQNAHLLLGNSIHHNPFSASARLHNTSTACSRNNNISVRSQLPDDSTRRGYDFKTQGEGHEEAMSTNNAARSHRSSAISPGKLQQRKSVPSSARPSSKMNKSGNVFNESSAGRGGITFPSIRKSSSAASARSKPAGSRINNNNNGKNDEDNEEENQNASSSPREKKSGGFQSAMASSSHRKTSAQNKSPAASLNTKFIKEIKNRAILPLAAANDVDDDENKNRTNNSNKSQRGKSFNRSQNNNQSSSRRRENNDVKSKSIVGASSSRIIRKNATSSASTTPQSSHLTAPDHRKNNNISTSSNSNSPSATNLVPSNKNATRPSSSASMRSNVTTNFGVERDPNNQSVAYNNSGIASPLFGNSTTTGFGASSLNNNSSARSMRSMSEMAQLLKQQLQDAESQNDQRNARLDELIVLQNSIHLQASHLRRKQIALDPLRSQVERMTLEVRRLAAELEGLNTELEGPEARLKQLVKNQMLTEESYIYRFELRPHKMSELAVTRLMGGLTKSDVDAFERTQVEGDLLAGREQYQRSMCFTASPEEIEEDRRRREEEDRIRDQTDEADYRKRESYYYQNHQQNLVTPAGNDLYSYHRSKFRPQPNTATREFYFSNNEDHHHEGVSPKRNLPTSVADVVAKKTQNLITSSPLLSQNKEVLTDNDLMERRNASATALVPLHCNLAEDIEVSSHRKSAIPIDEDVIDKRDRYKNRELLLLTSFQPEENSSGRTNHYQRNHLVKPTCEIDDGNDDCNHRNNKYYSNHHQSPSSSSPSFNPGEWMSRHFVAKDAEKRGEHLIREGVNDDVSERTQSSRSEQRKNKTGRTRFVRERFKKQIQEERNF